MEATANIHYIRISYRKLRDLSRNLRGMKAKKALAQLSFTPTKGARALVKAMESAVANATTNHKMNEESLVIKSVEILKGPFFKRWNPVSRGMAHEIKKRTSHIKIVLTDGLKEKKAESKKAEEEVKPVEIKPVTEAKEVKKEDAKIKKIKSKKEEQKVK